MLNYETPFNLPIIEADDSALEEMDKAEREQEKLYESALDQSRMKLWEFLDLLDC
jgi:hypothetical protein